jgi:hypothetical protein
MQTADKRRAPRVNVAVRCALRRSSGGSSIQAETLNLGPGGALLRTLRPLTIDESLEFSFDMRIAGPARVLRQEGHDVYALRFENPPEPMVRRLHELTTAAMH